MTNQVSNTEAFCYNCPMNYKQFLALQNRIEWLYEFHPDFFEQLTSKQRESLHIGVLYDVSDQDYPKSIEAYYNEIVSGDEELQKDMLNSAQALYDLSGSGLLNLDD